MAESYAFPVDGALNKTSLIKFDSLILAHISLNFIKTLMKVSLRDTNVYHIMDLSAKFTKIRR
ncbi:hypothetical protein MOSL_1293 [Moraxella osloensis]|nr:hypothetical protein MOSL_1293 [Moraxella osloensis]